MSLKPKARFICTKPQGLGTGTTVWLQKHGVSVRPTLSSKKIQEIIAVFELFDEDDSGAIVVEEAHTALKLLGLRASKSQVARLVETYDVNDSGDLDLDEFVQMMTEHLIDQEDSMADEGDTFDMKSLKDSEERGESIEKASSFNVTQIDQKQPEVQVLPSSVIHEPTTTPKMVPPPLYINEGIMADNYLNDIVKKLIVHTPKLEEEAPRLHLNFM